ncbi:MAG: antirestriction protein [Betaproteobacteria bacterium]|nr:antirestriction protein [Betaproteobacteria bacterium]
MTTEVITRRTLAEGERADFVHALFGLNFPLRLEPTIFTMADMLAEDYNGGFWQFYVLGNGGFYMAPDVDRGFEVSCENGFEGTLSADALGITACLYSYSHLSFGEGDFAETCAEQYHLLRALAMDHVEAGAILAACD